MATHRCNKEVEMGIMTEKINNIEQDVKYIKESLDKFPEYLEQRYVTKYEFRPIKTVIYGFIGILAVAIVGFLIWVLQKAIEKGVFS